jgi:hypothetical protein
MPSKCNQTGWQPACDLELRDVRAHWADGQSRHERGTHAGRDETDKCFVVVGSKADGVDSVGAEKGLRVRLSVTKSNEWQLGDLPRSQRGL